MPRVRPAGLPAHTLGYDVAAWMESHLVHGPGDILGDPYRLNDELLHFLAWAYELGEHGNRVVDEAMLSRGKGFAKTEFAAACAWVELAGPARFGGWDTDGQPVGVPVFDPWVIVAATSEEQTDQTIYGAFRNMGGPDLIAEWDIGLTRTYARKGNGACLPVTSSSVSRDGGRPSFQVGDETHLWHSRELRELYAVMKRNGLKRLDAEPWLFQTTTAYRPDEHSVAEAALDYGKTLGTKGGHRFLLDHLEASKRHRLDTDEGIEAAIREARGAAIKFTDLARMISWAKDPRTSRSEFLRYILNIPAKDSAGSWLSQAPGAWGRCAAPEIDLPGGSAISVAVDASLRMDSTAVAWCADLDGKTVVRTKIWEATPDNPIDHLAVMDWVRVLRSRHKITQVSYDPRFFIGQAIVLEGEGLFMVEIPQSGQRRSKIDENLFDLVVTGRLAHDGNETLERHSDDAAWRETEFGRVLSKRKSTGKIDGLVATGIAVWGLAFPATAPEIDRVREPQFFMINA